MCTVSRGVKSMPMLTCVTQRGCKRVEGPACEKKESRCEGNRSNERMQQEKLRGQGGIGKQGSEEEMILLPSWARTSLQIAAACIFRSPVVMVENCDMAAPGETGVGQKVTGDKSHQCNLFNRTMTHKSRTTRLHVGHRLADIEHPDHGQRPTEADRIYWGSEKGKVK